MSPTLFYLAVLVAPEAAAYPAEYDSVIQIKNGDGAFRKGPTRLFERHEP